MNANQSNLNSHIEEAISIFRKLIKYDSDIYILSIQKLFEKNNIFEKWQLEGFWKLCKSVVFKDIEIYYSIENDEDESALNIISKSKESDPIPSQFQKIPQLDSEIIRQIENLPNKMKPMSSIIQALFYCKNIFKGPQKMNLKWNKDFFEVMERLNVSIVLRGNLAQYSLYILDDKELSIFFANINLHFFYHLSKSLLNAEYLLLNNYTDLLDSIINYDFDFESDDSIEVPIIYLPYQIKSFIILAQYEREMCFRIKNMLQTPGISRIETSVDTEERADLLLCDNILKGEKYTSYYGKLVKSIVDMTMIDHAFKINEKNISLLANLYKRLTIVRSRIKTCNLDKKDFEKVLLMVETKALTMLNSIFEQENKINNNSNDLNYFFTIGDFHDLDLNPLLRRTSSEMSDAGNENIYIRTRLLNKGNHIELKPLIDNIVYYDSIVRKDVNLYNRYVRKSIENYGNMSYIIQKMNIEYNVSEVIRELSDFFREHKNEFTASLLYKSIRYVEKYISSLFVNSKNLDYNELNKAILLFSELLAALRDFVHKYKHSVPLRILPSFSYSFYSQSEPRSHKHFILSNDDVEYYDYRNYESIFFFASLRCSPLNIEYLSNIYETYLIKSSQFLIDSYGRMNTYLSNSIIEYEIKQIQTKDAIDSFRKKMANMLSTVRDNTREFRSESAEIRHQTMQVLGIFAAFLAFVTIAIGVSKVASSITEFIIFCSSYTLGLSVFVYLIKGYTEQEIKRLPDWRQKIVHYEKPVFVVLLIIGLLVALLFHSISDKKVLDFDHSQSTGIHIEKNSIIEEDHINNTQ